MRRRSSSNGSCANGLRLVLAQLLRLARHAPAGRGDVRRAEAVFVEQVLLAGDLAELVGHAEADDARRALFAEDFANGAAQAADVALVLDGHDAAGLAGR